MMKFLQVVILGLLLCYVQIECAAKASPEDELRNKLMADYNPKAIPATVTTVEVGLTILHITMNEQLQSMDIELWTKVQWNEPRFQWEASSYPDIKKLAFYFEDIWHPDLTLYNSIKGKNLEFLLRSQVLVFPTGKTMWVPPDLVKTSCAMDMKYWPYDTHKCSIKFGSWVNSVETIDLKLDDDPLKFEKLSNASSDRNLSRSDWEVMDAIIVREAKRYECCPEEYIDILATFTLKRIADAYTWTVLMPVIVLSLMTVAVFLLPPTMGEKILLGMVTLAIDCFFLFTVSKLIGHTSNHTPMLVQFISIQLVLCGVSVLLSCVILRLVKEPHTSGLPSFIKTPILALSSVLCLSAYKEMTMSDSTNIFVPSMKGEDVEVSRPEGQKTSMAKADCEWLLLAAAIDRIALIVYIVIFFITIIAYSAVL